LVSLCISDLSETGDETTLFFTLIKPSVDSFMECPYNGR